MVCLKLYQEYIRSKAKNSLVKKLANSVDPEGLDNYLIGTKPKKYSEKNPRKHLTSEKLKTKTNFSKLIINSPGPRRPRNLKFITLVFINYQKCTEKVLGNILLYFKEAQGHNIPSATITKYLDPIMPRDLKLCCKVLLRG